jgi:hypothetical protein
MTAQQSAGTQPDARADRAPPQRRGRRRPAVRWIVHGVLLVAQAISLGSYARRSRPLRTLSSDTVGSVEEDLLERPGQVAAPHQGRCSDQRLVLDADAHHFAGARELLRSDRPGPGSGAEGGAGQDRGGPVLVSPRWAVEQVGWTAARSTRLVTVVALSSLRPRLAQPPGLSPDREVLDDRHHYYRYYRRSRSHPASIYRCRTPGIRSACQGGELGPGGDTSEVCEQRCASPARSRLGPWPVAVSGRVAWRGNSGRWLVRHGWCRARWSGQVRGHGPVLPVNRRRRWPLPWAPSASG